jgi:phage-related protein
LARFLIKQSLGMKEMEYMHLSHSHIGTYPFLHKDKKIIITNAFVKKTDRLPSNEKDLALKLRQDYFNRNPGGK